MRISSSLLALVTTALLQALSDTPADSQERFKARNLLPSYARRLRDVGPAVGALSAELAGGGGEKRFSERYGGSGGDVTPETSVYIGVGRAITISGR